MGEPTSLEKRLIELETNMGLLQHDFEAQNEMILLNTKLLNSLQKKVEWLTSEIEGIKNNEGPESLEDQVPPHY